MLTWYSTILLTASHIPYPVLTLFRLLFFKMNVNPRSPQRALQTRQSENYRVQAAVCRGFNRVRWPLLWTTLLAWIIMICYRPDVGILFKHRWTAKDYPTLPDPSESVRLLYLEPGSWASRIECKSDAVSFAEKPTYNALSYTWGESKKTRWITVNGKRMSIEENLWVALQNIRHPTERQALWVDAICLYSGRSCIKHC
jgi:hypothetical protein